MSIKCAIIDDDPLSINILESYLLKYPEIEYVGSANNAINGKKIIEKFNPDLVFLDVEMPGLSGIEFLHTLTIKPHIIISSAKKEYAAESFDLQVLDYIVKPVTFQRFAQGLTRFFDRIKTHTQSIGTNHIFLNENKKMVKVVVDDILYIEGLKDYVKVVTSHRTVITKETLGFFEELLPITGFFRLHRSFIVALAHVDAYNSTEVEINGTEIPIGRNFKELFLERMNGTKSK